LSTESVGSRRELVANCVHTADADATNSFVAYRRRRCVLGIRHTHSKVSERVGLGLMKGRKKYREKNL